MRFKVLAIFVLSIILIPLLSFSAFGQDNLNYIVLKGGIYAPTGDLDRLNFGVGFNGEVAYGRYLNSVFALEVGAGYFETDGDVSVIPATLNAKGFITTPDVEIFGEVGVGAYFAEFDGILNTVNFGNITIDDNDTVFGIDVGLGARYNFAKNVFFGVEGKLIMTADAKFEGTASGTPRTVESNLNGFLVTANLGFRF